jgi:hypothetical protein
LNAELNPVCHFLALFGAHHIFHVSWIRVKGHEVAQSVEALRYKLEVRGLDSVIGIFH